MKKEQKRIKMQLYRQRIGSSKEIELYASDPRKKEKKKQYYIKNQKKIKDHQKKKYDEVLEEKKAFWHEENKKWEVRFLADYKKSRDQDVRKKNDWGLKFAKGYVQNGSKIGMEYTFCFSLSSGREEFLGIGKMHQGKFLDLWQNIYPWTADGQKWPDCCI